MKLYGQELDKELAKRKKLRDSRRDRKLTQREAAKTNDMGLSPSEYCGYEYGYDVCPHEEREKHIGTMHPPFLVISRCTKCGHLEAVGRADEISDEILEEAFQNTRRIVEGHKRTID